MNLCINDFEGPLDLLLHLVRSAKMDIYEIDTKFIIDEYLKFIDSLNKDDLDNASSYLVMASELIHLKSRLLLKLDIEEDEEDSEYSINSEEDLKNKLIEYERYQQVTKILKDLEENRLEFYTKIPEGLSDYKEENEVEKGVYEADILASALKELQKRMDYQKPVSTRITRREISIEERKKYIRDYIKTRKKVNFFDLFEDYSKEMVIATFLSILDMCKAKEVSLKQKHNFDNILIERI